MIRHKTAKGRLKNHPHCLPSWISIHPDEMSPREALDALYRLKRLADGEV